MKIVKQGITSRQLLFSVLAFVQGSSLLTAFFSDVMEQNSWMGVIIAYLIGLPVMLMYLFILSKHPGKGLIEINDILFGRVLGKVFTALYIFYFFSLIALNTYDVYSFIIGYMMPDTPPQVLALLFVLIPILLSRKGMDSIARLAALFAITLIVSMTVFVILQIKDLNPENLLPFFNMPIKSFVQGTHTILALPYCELVVFMMIIPMVDNQKTVRKHFLAGYSLGALILLAIVVYEVLVLGSAIGYFALPGFETIRMINLGNIINRMDTLYALMLYVLRFFKVSVLLYVCSLAVAQSTGLTQYRPIVAIIGVLAALLSVIVHESSATNFEWGKNTAAVYSSFFNLLLPFIAFVVCVIRSAIKDRKLKPATAKT